MGKTKKKESNKYEVKLNQTHLNNINNIRIEKSSNQLVILLFLNIITLLCVNHILKNNNITVIISYNVFYILIFSLIIIIGCIYGIIKKEIQIDIIFYSKVFLILNIIFLIYSIRYIYYLHIAMPYTKLIEVFNLVQVNHKIDLNFAIACSKEYCYRFKLLMMTEEEILNICSTTLNFDFDIIVERLETRNKDLIREYIANEKLESEKKTLLYKIKRIVSYIPNISSVFLLLSSYAHTPMIDFNFFNTIDIILSQAKFPDEIFDDYEGLFYFIFPEEYSDSGDFAARLI